MLLSIRESDKAVMFGDETVVDLYKRLNVRPLQFGYTRVFDDTRCGCLMTVLAMAKADDPDAFFDQLEELDDGYLEGREIRLKLGLEVSELSEYIFGWNLNTTWELAPLSERLGSLAWEQVNAAFTT